MKMTMVIAALVLGGFLIKKAKNFYDCYYVYGRTINKYTDRYRCCFNKEMPEDMYIELKAYAREFAFGR